MASMMRSAEETASPLWDERVSFGRMVQSVVESRRTCFRRRWDTASRRSCVAVYVTTHKGSSDTPIAEPVPVSTDTHGIRHTSMSVLRIRQTDHTLEKRHYKRCTVRHTANPISNDGPSCQQGVCPTHL